ncbi:Gp138 family membrane-puncturing spike protein [Fibrobacter sp. UWH4]|uniref:Gp138 family membrane-puncturing spike protein n=1 Tax=Fibrobacter sp. UWH4 TaxID=1896210 RepID=UPI00091A4737|nr:Gp138 family membrane-puncturing spike protein [Fibrobacter sp. UWH4]SHL04573.1 hypothetical protein SAMN05720762_10451 [Fibrobacter sp. UWH4]
MNQFVKLIRQVLDNYMEGFETAFPGVVKNVNDDGTVDVTPSIRNVLKNMQMEPDGEDDEPLPVEGVPVLWPGTSAAVVKFEIKAGDPVLCVASSRDLRAWVEAGEDGGPTSPLSFSGNDINDLMAIPLTRGGSKAVSVTLGRDSVKVVGKGSIEMKNDGTVLVNGHLEVAAPSGE